MRRLQYLRAIISPNPASDLQRHKEAHALSWSSCRSPWLSSTPLFFTALAAISTSLYRLVSRVLNVRLCRMPLPCRWWSMGLWDQAKTSEHSALHTLLRSKACLTSLGQPSFLAELFSRDTNADGFWFGLALTFPQRHPRYLHKTSMPLH